MPNKVSYSVIARFLAGEATEHDEKKIREWIEKSLLDECDLEQIRSAWEQSAFDDERIKIINQEDIRDKVWQQSVKTPGKAMPGGRRGTNFVYFTKIAASALIFVAVITSVYFFIYSSNGAHQMREPASWVHKQNPSGEKSKIFLPDGSIVWLNSASTLQFIDNFSDSNRFIKLTGEAYFEVVKDVNRPFIVDCRNVLAKALGTSFNINGYAQEAINVSLLKGKVIINTAEYRDDEGIILNPGEFSLMNEAGENLDIGKFDPEETTAWKDGILIFKDASFNEIKERLELWYGVEIVVNTKMRFDKHFNGKFNNENLQNVLENLSFAMDFEYQMKNKIVTIN
ncbi:MAG: DUF4974 domain-containing protein [Cytophagales bacterium]|nr:DUF4974 domain-containing protein [Cytophagales bacterium]